MLSAMVQANITYYHSAYYHTAERLKGGPLGMTWPISGIWWPGFPKSANLLPNTFSAD